MCVYKVCNDSYACTRKRRATVEIQAPRDTCIKGTRNTCTSSRNKMYSQRRCLNPHLKLLCNFYTCFFLSLRKIKNGIEWAVTSSPLSKVLLFKSASLIAILTRSSTLPSNNYWVLISTKHPLIFFQLLTIINYNGLLLLPYQCIMQVYASNKWYKDE